MLRRVYNQQGTTPFIDEKAKRVRYFICWFTPQRFGVDKADTRSLELNLGLPCGWQAPNPWGGILCNPGVHIGRELVGSRVVRTLNVGAPCNDVTPHPKPTLLRHCRDKQDREADLLDVGPCLGLTPVVPGI